MLLAPEALVYREGRAANECCRVGSFRLGRFGLGHRILYGWSRRLLFGLAPDLTGGDGSVFG